jgi:hypothetical protein
LYPPGINVERAPDIWTPLAIDFASGPRNNVFLRVVARLKPGITLAAAQAEVDALAADLRAQFTSRVKALTAEGRMTPAGMAAFARRDPTRTYSYENRDRAGLRPAQVARLKKNRKAFEFFQSQPPGYQRTIGYWVNSAAKEETRLRRLERLVTDCANGRRVGILEPKK